LPLDGLVLGGPYSKVFKPIPGGILGYNIVTVPNPHLVRSFKKDALAHLDPYQTFNEGLVLLRSVLH
jgi:hypothetical protein